MLLRLVPQMAMHSMIFTTRYSGDYEAQLYTPDLAAPSDLILSKEYLVLYEVPGLPRS